LGDGTATTRLSPVAVAFSGAAPASLTLALAPGVLAIPASGTAASAATATVRDANGNALAGQTVTYSLPTPKTGVSVNGSTGAVTVSPAAAAGAVTIQATSGSVTGTATLTLTPAAASVALQATAGGTYHVSVKGSQISSFAGTTYTVAYDPAQLELLDFAAQAKRARTAPGAAEGTGLTIVSHSDGLLAFTVQKTLTGGRKWSGALTVLKFRALSSGSSTVQVF
jgi:hypothetical protein